MLTSHLLTGCFSEILRVCKQVKHKEISQSSKHARLLHDLKKGLSLKIYFFHILQRSVQPYSRAEPQRLIHPLVRKSIKRPSHSKHDVKVKTQRVSAAFLVQLQTIRRHIISPYGFVGDARRDSSACQPENHAASRGGFHLRRYIANGYKPVRISLRDWSA